VAIGTSTLSPPVQRIASEELELAMAEWNPLTAVVVVLDAQSGHVLAAEARDHGRSDPTLAGRKVYVTGSTLKTFTIGAALEAHTVQPNTIVDCASRRYGKDELFDDVPRGRLTVSDVLAVSSNTGTSRVYDTLGPDRLLLTLRLLHFGEAPGRVPAVSDGASFAAALIAIGETTEATPLQVAGAYAAIFNQGSYVAPSLTVSGAVSERVFSPETAQALVAMLENAVERELGTGKAARIQGARVAGKTGTAPASEGRMVASFVGTVLGHAPTRVVLVEIEAEGRGITGPSAAAPVFARVAQRLTSEAATP
jgi:cell division protein FtsI (penicillin-binding protein 3)